MLIASVNWGLVVAAPTAIGAIIAFGLYFVGLIRPMAVIKPRYWHVQDTTLLSVQDQESQVAGGQNIHGYRAGVASLAL